MYDELLKRPRSEAIYLPEKFSKNAELLDVLMQAADAIEQLRNAGSAYGRGWTLGYDAGREENKPRWISVEERLPESVCKSYLCLTDTGYHCEVRWTNNVYGLWKSDNKWGWSIADVPQYCKVTHWMPLPEPPKEEANV